MVPHLLSHWWSILLQVINLACSKELYTHRLMSNRIDVNSDKYKLLTAIFFKQRSSWVQAYLLTAYGGEDLRVLADDKINENL